MAKSTGTVKWFSGQKGYGFIAPDAGGDDVFVHHTEISSDGFRTLREGQKVEFVVDSGDDGRSKAVDVVGLIGDHRSSGGRGRKGGGRGGYGRGRGGEGVECYNCGRMGHLARDCYRSGSGGAYRGGSGRGYGGGRGGGDGGRGGACYNCGEEGHFARDCQN